jgi:signal transduction histidine kinase
VELSVYRIVQEALTNVRKHAGPAHTAVVLRYLPGAVEAEVSEDGSGSPTGYAGGHGLIGMKERANLYGGTVQAGPGPAGGYVVRASIPLATIR